MLINCGIRRVVAQKRYQKDAQSMAIFARANVEIVIVHEQVETYGESKL
jgi:deoxycytidylate deaminase